MFKVIFVLCLLVLNAQAEDIEYKKIHLVDFNHTSKNYLFRGNMPVNATSFAYDQLIAFMRKRAEGEGGFKLPQNLYLLDIALNNVFDNNKHELDFWKHHRHANLGKFIEWPIGFAGVVPPEDVPKRDWKEMAEKKVWGIDEIPKRVTKVWDWMIEPQTTARVIYIHCSGGCDRTGEMIGAYRMKYNLHRGVPAGGIHSNVTVMYADDIKECGRPPNYWSTTALKWFCLNVGFRYNTKLGSCLDFAHCTFAGHCHAGK